jgi:hypothetical protein
MGYDRGSRRVLTTGAAALVCQMRGEARLRRRAVSTRHTLGPPQVPPPARLRDPEGSRSHDVTLSPPVGALLQR